MERRTFSLNVGETSFVFLLKRATEVWEFAKIQARNRLMVSWSKLSDQFSHSLCCSHHRLYNTVVDSTWEQSTVIQASCRKETLLFLPASIKYFETTNHDQIFYHTVERGITYPLCWSKSSWLSDINRLICLESHLLNLRQVNLKKHFHKMTKQSERRSCSCRFSASTTFTCSPVIPAPLCW